VKNGEAQLLTKEKLLERIAASRKTPAPVVALRIPAADLALARRQAEEKGLPYQTYIKSLFHETLSARGKRDKAHWTTAILHARTPSAKTDSATRHNQSAGDKIASGTGSEQPASAIHSVFIRG
jgi:hypothetical protein